MEKEKDIISMMKLEDKTALHKYLGIKSYSSVDDFVQNYVKAVVGGDKRDIFNTVVNSDKLLPRVNKDFEKNGIFYPSSGGMIKKVSQKENLVKITFSTMGGYNTKNNTDSGGKPDFALIFSLKENVKVNVEKGDIIDFLGYSDDKLVLILGGDPIKINNLDVIEIHAVKLHNKVKDMPTSKVKQKL